MLAGISGAALIVTVNGDQIDGLLQASISTRNCYSADSFSATFALGPIPLTDIGYWSSTPSAYVEIIAPGELGPASQTLISGLVDTVIIDPVYQTVAVEGRDLSASMIDSYRQQDFVNQTASEVVACIAQGHGLVPIVTATTGSVGRYYGDGYTRLSLGQFSRLRSDWDLVVQLARENGFDVFVQDRTLFFQPTNPLLQSLTEIPIALLERLRVDRSLSIPSTPAARVQSWNSQTMSSVDSCGTDSTAGSSITNTGTFLFSTANLTSSQATGSAERYAAELSRLNTSIYIEMPWDLNLMPRQNIVVSGAGLPLDLIFRIENIDRRYNSTYGSKQHVHAVQSA